MRQRSFNCDFNAVNIHVKSNLGDQFTSFRRFAETARKNLAGHARSA
jgi:hypothetical protein